MFLNMVVFLYFYITTKVLELRFEINFFVDIDEIFISFALRSYRSKSRILNVTRQFRSCWCVYV